MTQDTRAFISACSVCSRGKSSHQPPTGLLNPLPIFSGRTLQSILSLLFPCQRGMMVDRFLQNCASHAPSSPLRENVDILVRHVFHLHGFPREPVWRDSCCVLGASMSLSSGYHPQSNSQMERANQTLESTLCFVTAQHPASWSSFLPWLEYAHNSLVAATTGMSPFMA